MATLRELRRKIQSVGNIQKITQAMEVVAASQLRKAQAKAESSRPYAAKLKEILDRLMNASDDCHHPLASPRTVKKTGLVIIAGDRGLCGAYNQTVFNAAEKFLKQYEPDQVQLIPVGRKAIDYFESRPWTFFSKLEDWEGKITYPQIEAFTRTLIHAYVDNELDEIWTAYTHFINMGAREVRVEKFLSITPSVESSRVTGNYIFEPDAPTIFAEILPRYCMAKMQSALNEAYTSELAARISSMHAATKNAEEMIENLTLMRNKVRQAGITRELIEITSGAEGLR